MGLATAQLACSEVPRVSNFHLATVAASPEHGLLFLAQPGFGTVDALRVISDGSPSQAPQFFRRMAQSERSHVLRLSVDRRGSRLWIVDFRMVQAYELPSLKEVRRYVLPANLYHERFVDLVLDSFGNAFVLSRGGARVHRIDALTLEMETWADLGDRAADAALLLANRALITPDDRFLLIASPTGRGLLSMDLESRRVTAVKGVGADFSCGLLFWDDQAAIQAFDCTGQWEARIELTPDRKKGTAVVHGEERTTMSITRFTPNY